MTAGDMRRTRRRAIIGSDAPHSTNSYRRCRAGGSARLLVAASAVALPSALVCLMAPAPFATAFVSSPAMNPFCACGNVQALRRTASQKRALPGGTTSDETRRPNGVSGIQMLWSGGRRTKGNEVTVNIERTSMNSRRISGSIVINRPIEDVWLTLTDYNRLAEYVPNLTQSKVKPSEDGAIRLWQEGAQKIIGFDFRASVEMFMQEHFGDPENRMAQRKLTFGLVQSQMFNEFDGEWRMQFNSRKPQKGSPSGDFEYSTKLFYMVHIKPKGPVPVLALEWQISNEVPNNLAALKKAAEAVTPEYAEMRCQEREAEGQRRKRAREARRGVSRPEDNRSQETDAGMKLGAEAFVPRENGGSDFYAPTEWDTDETLEAYIAKG